MALSIRLTQFWGHFDIEIGASEWPQEERGSVRVLGPVG
jgi:hypothetical protein